MIVTPISYLGVTLVTMVTMFRGDIYMFINSITVIPSPQDIYHPEYEGKED